MTDDFERQLAELAKIDAELDARWQRIHQLAHDDLADAARNAWEARVNDLRGGGS
jgi:hypothetical protein